MKWSVVIPTLWKSTRIFNLLESLDTTPDVGEIILINNAPEHTPVLPKLEKLKILSKGENIFVNPAWNLGVAEASFTHIALCNDDIEFEPSLFARLQLLDFEKRVIGCSADNFSADSSTGDSLEIFKGHCISKGWGCLLFFQRSDYQPIPEQLKIWCGDDWLVHTFNHIQSFKWPIQTDMSTSSGIPSLNVIAQNDKLALKQLISKRESRRIDMLNSDQFGSFRIRDEIRYVAKKTQMQLRKSRFASFAKKILFP